MTTVVEVRQDHEGNPYPVVLPTKFANDKAVDTTAANVLREFLYRRGISVSHIPDDLLLWQVANTFRDHRSALETGTISLGETTT